MRRGRRRHQGGGTRAPTAAPVSDPSTVQVSGPVCVGTGETLGSASELIRCRGVPRAVVVDDAGRSTGMVLQLADWRARLPAVVRTAEPPSGSGARNVAGMVVAPPPRRAEDDTLGAVQLLPWLMELMRSAATGAACEALDSTRRAVGLGQPPGTGSPAPACLPGSPLPPPIPQSREGAPDPYVGQRAGSWRLVARIGQGGMGVVYRATHPSGRLEAAVKVLAPVFAADAFMVARFLREVRAEKLVHDDRVVNVYECGRLEDGTPYFAMELLDGVPLAHVLRSEGRLEPRRALHVGREIAAGLAAAHRAGVVHRDLKPGNVMLVPAGAGPEQVKLLDFGIAKVPVGDGTASSLTAADARLGTPYYMAPEQILGGEVDGRADVYAFGVVMFQMLAGELPFPAPPEEAMRRHILERAPRLAERGVLVPAALEELVARCLKKTRSERPAGFEEVGAALAAASQELDGDGGRAAGGDAERPAWGGARHARMPVLAVAAVAVVAFVGGTGLGRRAGGTPGNDAALASACPAVAETSGAGEAPALPAALAPAGSEAPALPAALAPAGSAAPASAAAAPALYPRPLASRQAVSGERAE